MINRNKRILFEIKDICNQYDFLKNYGIQITHNTNDIYQPISVILGNENTPYQYGFFIIHSKYREQYPFVPIYCKFHSMCDKRIHPNLYTNGKICLSILGTFTGPEWTPCYNLKNVIISIKSLFVDNPMKCEPGINSVDDIKVSYNEIVEYNVIQNYLIKQYQLLVENELYNTFKKLIDEFIINNINKVTKHLLNKCNKFNNTIYRSSIYNKNVEINYNKLLEEWKEFIQKYNFTEYLENILNKQIFNQNIFEEIIIQQINETIVTEQINETMVTEQINVNETIVTEQINETIDTEQINETIVTEPVNETLVTEPVNETLVTEPVNETLVTEPVNETIVTELVNETIVTELVNETMVTETNIEKDMDTNSNGKKKRLVRRPTLLAKDFEEGYEMLSDIDGRWYKIHIYSRNVFVSGEKRTYQVKRWILKK